MSKDYSLSLRGEAFNSLCADFDTTLRDVLAGMIETEQNTGEINIIKPPKAKSTPCIAAQVRFSRPPQHNTLSTATKSLRFLITA